MHIHVLKISVYWCISIDELSYGNAMQGLYICVSFYITISLHTDIFVSHARYAMVYIRTQNDVCVHIMSASEFGRHAVGEIQVCGV